MDYLYCVCDLDGTVLDSLDRISNENLNAFKLLGESGIKLVVATGRSHLLIKEYLYDMDIKTPVIACNGGLILDNSSGEIIYKKLIPQELVKAIINFCGERQIEYLLYTTDTVFHNRNNKRIEKFIKYSTAARDEFKIPIQIIEDADKGNIIQSTIKILITTGSFSLMEELSLLFNKDDELTIVSSMNGLIDIMASNTTKGNALTYLAEFMGMDLEKTVVFGDNYNDISMFEVAGMGIAVENAEEELKNVATYVTLSNEESGVGYAINKYVLSGV